jgi:membrane associated rhomboid family serine protease
VTGRRGHRTRGAIPAVRPVERVLGGTATQWFTILVAVNIVFLLSQPLGSVAHLTGLAVGAAYGRWLRPQSG